MIDQATLLTYLAVLLGFVFIPGPAVILTMARASSSGVRVGVATGLGIAVGDLLHTAMAIIGLSALILTSAFAFSVVKYLGAAYLVYLGLCAFRDKADMSALVSAPKITSRQAFKQAVLAELLNPKSAMFFLAFLPQFVNPANGAIALQLSILGILFVAMGLVSTITVAIFSGRVGHFLRRNPAVQRWQNKCVGAIYCALGVRLALQEK